MSEIVKRLTDTDGNVIIPITKAANVETSDKSNVQAKLNQLNNRLTSVNTDITNINEKIDQKSAAIDEQLTSLDDKIDRQVDAINNSITQKETALNNTIAQKENAVNQKIDGVKQDVSELSAHVDNEVSRIDQTMESFSSSIDDLDAKVDREVETLNSTITEAVNDLNTAIDEKAAELTERIDGVSASVDDLEEKVDELIEHPEFELGDRIAKGTGELSILLGNISENNASGMNSIAEGNATIASNKSQHVFGEFNDPDPSENSANIRGEYVEIVGNGTADDARSNARTLDWSGNETLAGKLTVGADPTENMDVTTKQYVDNGLSTKANASDLAAKANASDLTLKVDKPTASPNGTSGQFLKTNGDGTTTWADVSTATDAQVENAVGDWLTGHPEATTTVQDGAITKAKLDSNLQSKVDDVDNLKSDLSILVINEIITVPTSTSYHAFAFVSNHTYRLVNNTTSSMNAYTFTEANSSGAVVETIMQNWVANEVIMFTPTQNAPAFRIYANASGTVTIEDISVGVPKLEVDVSELQEKSSRTVFTDGVRQVTEANTTFFSQSANLFNKETVLDNYNLTQNGSDFYEATGYMVTEEYIDVRNLNSIKALSISNGTVVAASIQYVLYDANKTALNKRTVTNAVLDTSNASYLRFGTSLGQKDVLMIVPGDTDVAEYIPYGFTFDYAEENEATLVKINPTDDVIQKLLDNKGKDIYFSAGDYDIIAQYEAHFGSNYFTNYTYYTSGGDNLGAGLPIYRGTKVTFSQGAVFTANYTGSNNLVRTNFSAFWLQSDVIVDGLRLSVTGIRNCIHDDFDNTYNGTTIIKNCHLTGDTNIIAGGLGVHETVIIENCYIERTSGSATYDFSYHNNGNEGAQSTIVVKDNYLARGFSVRWYGASTLLTDVLVSNNSMMNDVDIRAENSTATIENINLKSWNNEIRTA